LVEKSNVGFVCPEVFCTILILFLMLKSDQVIQNLLELCPSNCFIWRMWSIHVLN